MEKAPRLTSDKVDEVKEALGILQDLVFFPNMALRYPLASDRAYSCNDALHALRGVIPQEWFQRAASRWVELALNHWEAWIVENRTFGASYYGSYQVDGVSLAMIQNRLEVGQLGSETNHLMDRFLDLLHLLHDEPFDSRCAGQVRVAQERIRQTMSSLINRRSNCIRPGDPHRDDALRGFLRQKYRFS